VKKLFLVLVATAALMMAGEGAMKCGAGKCGASMKVKKDVKKDMNSTKKCGSSMKCGTGKCGGGK